MAEMIDCRIEDNMGYYNSLGGGVYCWQSEVLLAGCTIASNGASGNIKGGGLYAGGSFSDVLLQNCIISENSAEIGGGIYIGSNPGGSSDSVRESVTIVNCTIANNNLSGSFSNGGGIHSVSSDITIANSIVWYNDGQAIKLISPYSSSPVLYSDVEGGYSGQGNINEDPMFASAGGDDYHLQSALGRYNPWNDRWINDNNHSPCIDAGDPHESVGAEPLPNGRCINMGAYGGTVEASKGDSPWIYHVDGTNGSNWNSGLSRSEAFATIQKAVDVAYSGDTIMVWPGVYNEDIKFEGKSITLQSADDAAVITSDYYALSFYSAESSNCVVRNFVITGCAEAGIYCLSASPTLTNLTITGNLYGIMAGGGANPDIVNCILWNNENGDLYHCQADYSCLAQSEALDWGIGNFSDDPEFADPDRGDYHLKSRHGRYSPNTGSWVYDSVTSPCIDAGSPNMEPGREQIPHGGRINVGAYGGTAFASLSRNSW
jgi:hypothetical protein